MNSFVLRPGLDDSPDNADNQSSIIAALYEALKAAEEHLEYCNYGDRWEREGAIASKLPEKIEAALALVDKS